MQDRQSSIVNRQSTRLLTFGGGGWVLVLAGMIGLLLVAWAVAPALMRSASRPPGDGKNIDSYRFDLSNLQVPRELVVAAMLHRDMAPALISPTFSGPDASADEDSRWKSMQKRNDPRYGKYLVPTDLVIGVEIAGAARAYPIHVMYVHEIVNDVLAGVPIAVTYNWLCDSAMVFDRRVDEQVLEFGVSGLVYNSNLLMYDRQQAHQARDQAAETDRESLWSQLLARAVSGPAAGAGSTLTILPADLVTWSEWVNLHPDTTVLDRDLRLYERYKDAAPTAYFNSDRLLFPAKPLPPEDGPAAKTPVLAVTAAGVRRVYVLDDILRNAQDGVWTDTLGALDLRFIVNRQAQTVRVETDPPGQKIQVIRSFWFAWRAMHPEDELHKP